MFKSGKGKRSESQECPHPDLEFAIRTDEFFKRWFARSLVVHIILSILLYLLLGLHIWSGIHFGLRRIP